MRDMEQIANVYAEVGGRIHSTRILRGYTRKQLAELASISPKFLYEIENGKKGFSVAVLYNLCDALQVDSNYILKGKEKSVYDNHLVEAIELFDRGQTERLSTIIRQIYELHKQV